MFANMGRKVKNVIPFELKSETFSWNRIFDGASSNQIVGTDYNDNKMMALFFWVPILRVEHPWDLSQYYHFNQHGFPTDCEDYLLLIFQVSIWHLE